MKIIQAIVVILMLIMIFTSCKTFEESCKSEWKAYRYRKAFIK